MRKFFFSHKTETAVSEQPEQPRDEIVRENFTLQTDEMKVSEIVEAVRQRTVDFSFNHVTTWAITDLDYKGVEIRCKLTKAQDIKFFVNGTPVRSQLAAIEAVNNAITPF